MLANGPVSGRQGTRMDLVDWFIGELDKSPTAQALFFFLVVAGRFMLDRWERKRQIEQERKKRTQPDG